MGRREGTGRGRRRLHLRGEIGQISACPMEQPFECYNETAYCTEELKAEGARVNSPKECKSSLDNDTDVSEQMTKPS